MMRNIKKSATKSVPKIMVKITGTFDITPMRMKRMKQTKLDYDKATKYTHNVKILLALYQSDI
jgi:hypothetical protein